MTYHYEPAERLQPISSTPIIVIDPGHGGDNLGTIENNHEEKSMTMVTAKAMYDELSLYDNVTVYLTRRDDRELSLKERAQFAADKNADFLFSIHYNASENHELYGAEVWTSAFSPFNQYGYQFGSEFLVRMKELGLLNRGVKTRLNDRGTDYYGILREARELEIPAVIIEHCHVDEAHDEAFCDSTEDLVRFGIEDATAVAKYFGLKSSILNVDYSDYKLSAVSGDQPVPVTLRDQTAPEHCEITMIDADYEAGSLTFEVCATDRESPVMYYDYSINGGKEYSSRESWESCDTLTGTYQESMQVTLLIPSGTKPIVRFRAYNMYDLGTESNFYQSPVTFSYGEESVNLQDRTDLTDETSITEPVTEVISTNEIQKSKDVSFLMICMVTLILLFAMILVSRFLADRNRRRNRIHRRKDSGNSRNQPE